MTNYDAIEQLTKLKGVCEQMGWSNNVKALEMAISTLKTPQLWTSPLLPRGAYTESEEQMNDFKSKLDDLLDELERCCASQHFEVADDVRAKIHKLIEDKIKEK